MSIIPKEYRAIPDPAPTQEPTVKRRKPPPDRQCGTKSKAWDMLSDTLEHDGVCYDATDGSLELRPKHGTMNYGEAVRRAVENFAETNPTIAQIEAVERLCHWVALAALRGNG